MKKAIIFDLDGTLWDSAAAATAGLNEVLAGVPEFSLRLSTGDMRQRLGKPALDIMRAILPKDLSEARFLEISTALCVGDVDYLRKSGAPLYPLVKETLRALGETYALYIVSNCQKNYIEAFLAFHRLGDTFDGHLCAGDTGKSKGENIRAAAKTYKIDRAVYIGDTDGDFQAAKEAGLPFIHAAYGYGRPSDPTPAVYTFEDIPQAVKELLG